MVVIKDEPSVEEAVQLLEQHGAVRYSDRYSYRTFRSPDTLRAVCLMSLERGEGAMISCLDEDTPSYETVWLSVKKEIVERKKRDAREWIQKHPEEVRAMMKRMGYKE